LYSNLSAKKEITMDTTNTNNLRARALADLRRENAAIRRRLRVHGGHAPSVAHELDVSVRRVEAIRDASEIPLDRTRWPGKARYSDDLRNAGLAEYDRLGTIKGAVRTTGVPEGTLRGWIRARAD
jgi:hypothetical protein